VSLAERLDDLLRERVFQRIADAVRDRTGASCFALAAQFAVGIAATSGAWAAASAWRDGPSWVVAFLAIINIAWARVAHRRACAAERTFLSRQALPPPHFGCGPSPRLTLAALTPYCLLWLVDAAHSGDLRLVAVELANFAGGIISCSYLYFMICRPKPPRRQESRAPDHAVMAGAS
jgi:hypothetical protein